MGSGWVPRGGGVSEQALTASTGDITDHPPPLEPPPLFPPSTPILSSPRLLSRRSPILPRPSPLICEGGDSLSVTSLSRFLGIGVGSSPEREARETRCLSGPH